MSDMPPAGSPPDDRTVLEVPLEAGGAENAKQVSVAWHDTQRPEGVGGPRTHLA